MSAREEVLGRVRAALRDVPAGERPDGVPVTRGYRRRSELSEEELVAQFADRVEEYNASATRAPGDEIAGVAARICAGHGIQSLAVPDDLPEDWLPGSVSVTRDDGLGPQELDGVDGVMTGCALAIAQTGTIVLDGGPYQGRRAVSLVPDFHLCVVRADHIVGLVPEAIDRLGANVRAARRPLTFCSGPSATSDIELDRVEGVHGPRTLEVLIVRAASEGSV